MAVALVKCPLCNEQFDRNNPAIEWVKYNNTRYAHKKCMKERDLAQIQEEKDKNELYKYLSQLFGGKYDYGRTKKLVEKYKREFNYTYSGMIKSLRWFYELKGNNIERANGSIAILPYIYNEAQEYYYNVYKAQQRANMVREQYEVPVQEVTIKSPKVYTPPPRMFNLEGGN